jgi:NAD(P)H-dependent FMN reductase
MRKLVCICGTSRPGNFSSHALAVIMDELKQRGEAFELFDAASLQLNFPGFEVTADAERMSAAVRAADGVIFCGPEYHGSISAMSKLILENMGFPSALKSKPMALAGVADGRIGAIKSLEQMKSICSHIGAILVPGAISVAGVQTVFNEQGECLDAGTEKALRSVAAGMLDFLDTYVCPRQRLQELEEQVRENHDAWTTST